MHNASHVRITANPPVQVPAMTPELVFLTPSDASEASAFVRPIWIDTYAGIIYGGRERAELIFDG